MKALHAAAAGVDIDLQKSVRSMEAQHRKIEAKIAKATSPLEKAKLEKTLYDLNETAGAARFSGVTGEDSSEL